MLRHNLRIVAGLYFAVQRPVEVSDGLILQDLLGSVRLILLGVLRVHVNDFHCDLRISKAFLHHYETAVGFGVDAVDLSVRAHRR